MAPSLRRRADTNSTRTTRTLVYFSGSILAGAFGAVVAGAITDSLDGAHGIAGWRWLFIAEGVVTAGTALFAPLALLDYPATCRKPTPGERKLAVRRIQADGITAAVVDAPKLGPFRAFIAAISNWWGRQP